MFKAGDYIRRIDTESPVGIVESVNEDRLTVVVRWGVADGRVYSEELLEESLELAKYNIFSPDQIQKRQIKEAGTPYHEIEEQ